SRVLLLCNRPPCWIWPQLLQPREGICSSGQLGFAVREGKASRRKLIGLAELSYRWFLGEWHGYCGKWTALHAFVCVVQCRSGPWHLPSQHELLRLQRRNWKIQSHHAHGAILPTFPLSTRWCESGGRLLPHDVRSLHSPRVWNVWQHQS